MVFPGIVDDLPPLMAAAECIGLHGALVTVVAVGASEAVSDHMASRKVRLISLARVAYPGTVAGKFLLRLSFSRLLRRAAGEATPDVIWYHGGHAMAYSGVLRGCRCLRVAHAHELYDRMRRLRMIQNEFLRKADLCIVPEENRAWILKVDSGARAPFVVVPNCPPMDSLPAVRDKDAARTAFHAHGGSPECGRFIIYQGLMDPGRSVVKIVEAFRQLEDRHVGLILLGWGAESYIAQVRAAVDGDGRIAMIPRVPPPGHLEITAGCSVGVISYEPTSLNTVYCAPNKLWEYALLGVAVLAPAYPGLKGVIGRTVRGTTYDPASQASMKKGMADLLNGKIGEDDFDPSSFPSVPKLYADIHARLCGGLSRHE